ncbi:putative reverse transcriptase domain-containing protein [Tanacetum coccineum]|uniref:Reverse transcriptase domain-containing protein n=1 Tax=Tanacetum coccineum TaxID=301880 RepID=A0ABQ5E9M7_9ASTR
MNSRYLIQDDPSPYHFLQGIMSRDISALTTPPPSPLTPLSSPLPQIPSPPPNSPTHIEIPRVVLPLRRGIGARSSSISSNDKREERAKDGSVCIEFRVTVSRYSRQRVISSYWASDHKNHVQLTKTMRCSKGLQTQMVEFQRQHGPAEGPSQPDALGEAGLLFRKWHQEEGHESNPRCDTNIQSQTLIPLHHTYAQIQAMINEGVTAALAARDATRNGDDSHTSGTGVRRPVQMFRKMESVYSISNCTVACQVKFATCTLQGNALTWWNSHVKTTTHEAAHAMPWRTLKKMMIDKYCPRGEIKKLEYKCEEFEG